MIVKNNIYKFSSFPHTAVQATSTRYFGSIKDKDGFHKDHLSRFAYELEIDPENIIFPNQRHTGNVDVITYSSSKLSFLEIDGLVTKDNGIILGVVTADCLPIIFYDPKNEIVGIAHVGYKGILNRILENMISMFIKLGSSIENILVGIGPGIGVCCYSVTMERIKRFLNLYPKCKNLYKNIGDQFFLNLGSIAEYALISMGINLSHVEKANICTKHNLDKFYSYRGDTKYTFGEFASIIGISNVI